MTHQSIFRYDVISINRVRCQHFLVYKSDVLESTVIILVRDVDAITSTMEYALGNNRFLTATHFNGERIVHLREYEERNGQRYATRKGVSFDKNRFAAFVSQLKAIDEARKYVEKNVNSSKVIHIGGRLYATVKSDIRCIDIRQILLRDRETITYASRNRHSTR